MLQLRRTGPVAGALSLATAFALLTSAAPASAAPVTVDLRVEGKTRTLFEGPVTTDVRTFRFTTSATEHRCDGTAPAGTSATPVPTRGAALAAASLAAPFSTSGAFSSTFGSPSFTEIAGESTAFDAGTNEYLVEYLNGAFAQRGSCGDPIAPGDDLLFAYGTGSEPRLALAGPATARPGDPVELTVTDGAQPIAGAAVGGAVTDAAGKARVALAQRGDTALKATRAGAIRSNRLVVCVTDGQDGSCGTRRPDGTPAPGAAGGGRPAQDTGRPVGRVQGLTTGASFTRARAPRTLRIAATDPFGVAQVKLRLTRRRGGRCAYLSGSKDRFVASRCGRSFAFRASDAGTFSYLLPERLTRGRYVLDVVAIDRAGNRDVLARGRSRIVFTVR